MTSRTLRPSIILGLTTFLLTAAIRFLSLNGFPNDHFVHLGLARQIVLGDLPVRDFQDPGRPLMYGPSVVAQLLLGQTLFSEAVLIALAFGLAATITAAVVLRLTASIPLALGAIAFEVLIFPRTYSYPKLLLYAAAFLLFDRYVERPTRGRFAAMVTLVAVAFLVRHDHGVFLCIGGSLTAALASAGDGAVRVKRAATFIAYVAVLLLPYFVYVHAAEGLWLYIRTAIAFSRREASHSVHVWPNLVGPDAAYAVLVYLFYALPLIAVAVARRYVPQSSPRIVPIAVVALLIDASFIRDPLMTRVPDAIVPAVILGAWLTAQAQAGKRRAVVLSAWLAIIATAAWATMEVGDTREELDRMGVRGVSELGQRFAERSHQLRARFDPNQMPSDTIPRMRPFLAYLDRCTADTDRLLTAGFLPEVPYYAHRGFAGGQNVFMYGYFDSSENQLQVVERLRSQQVPFVLIPSDYAKDLEEDFPIVNSYVVQRYTPLMTVDIHERLSIAVLVERARAPISRDRETGWPCFR